MEKFWKKPRKILSNILSNERDYLKEIEQTIESFRFMSEEEQFKSFQVFSWSIESNLVEGDFDNKVHIKYLMRFIKIIKTKIFFPNIDPTKHEKLALFYMPAFLQIKRFVDELRSIERIKEDDFLNILNHAERAHLNNVLKYIEMSFRAIIVQLIKGVVDFDGAKDFFATVKKDFAEAENDIKEIIGEAMQKIAEQEKINKLKIASETFKKKARGYKLNSLAFLVSAALLAVGVFLFAFSKEIFGYEFFGYDIKFFQEFNANSSAFYIYFILENLFRGKLLFYIMALTGFFYCLRFFASSQHNAIICDQRANTLESFEALYENVGKDNVGKDNVGKKAGKKAVSKAEDKVEDREGNREGSQERLLVVEKVLNSATEHLPTGFSKQQSDSGVGGIVSSLASLLKR